MIASHCPVYLASDEASYVTGAVLPVGAIRRLPASGVHARPYREGAAAAALAKARWRNATVTVPLNVRATSQ